MHDFQFIERLCMNSGFNRDQCVIRQAARDSSNYEFLRRKTIELTKNNISKNFMFIGILDHLKLSLGILENLLPRFFRETNLLYLEKHWTPTKAGMKIKIFKPAYWVKQNKDLYSAYNKIELNDLDVIIRTELENIFADEIDIYQFIEARLFNWVNFYNLGQSDSVATEFLKFRHFSKS